MEDLTGAKYYNSASLAMNILHDDIRNLQGVVFTWHVVKKYYYPIIFEKVNKRYMNMCVKGNTANAHSNMKFGEEIVKYLIPLIFIILQEIMSSCYAQISISVIFYGSMPIGHLDLRLICYCNLLIGKDSNYINYCYG